MSDWRLLDHDGYRKLYFRHNESTGRDEFKTVEDVAPLISMNQKARNDETGNWKGDMHHVASVPPAVWKQWWQEFGGNPMLPENQPRLMQKLNDRDYSKMRVKSGRL